MSATASNPPKISRQRPDVDYKFEQPSEVAPPTVDDEIRRKEEEELQKVLEMSMQDRGGRPQWSQYSATGGPASGPSALNKSSTATVSAPHPFAQPKYPGGGYVPARTPSPQQQQHQQPQTQPQAQLQRHTSSIPSALAAGSSAAPAVAVASTTATTTATPAAAATSDSAIVENGNIVTRVRALHTFEPTEPGELAFEKGDIIKVVDRGYKDWWRGQLKGRTGIFPVNYVVCFIFPIEASPSLFTFNIFFLQSLGSHARAYSERASERSRAGSSCFRSGCEC